MQVIFLFHIESKMDFKLYNTLERNILFFMIYVTFSKLKFLMKNGKVFKITLRNWPCKYFEKDKPNTWYPNTPPFCI